MPPKMGRGYKRRFKRRNGFKVAKMSNTPYPIYKPLSQNQLPVKIKSTVELSTSSSVVQYWFGTEGYSQITGIANYSRGYGNYLSKFSQYAGVYQEYTLQFLKVKFFPVQYGAWTGGVDVQGNFPYHTAIEPDLSSIAATTVNAYTPALLAQQSNYRVHSPAESAKCTLKSKYYVSINQPTQYRSTTGVYAGANTLGSGFQFDAGNAKYPVILFACSFASPPAGATLWGYAEITSYVMFQNLK